MGSVNKPSNIYWSLRRYVYETLPTLTAYYVANQFPVPKDKDRWIVVQELDTPRLSRLTVQNFRIHCVVKNNPDDEPLQNLKSDIINAFEQTNQARYIAIYDKDTSAQIGRMWVDKIMSRPAMAYEGGISVKPIDITLKYMADRYA